jgi:hypothetical protein
MKTPWIPILFACLILSGCCSIRDGVIVEKKCRGTMPEVYDLYSLNFRYEPSVYWVRVEGKDAKGRDRFKDVILFRHDWMQLRVGDHWTRKGGFSPAEAGK